MDMSQFVAGEYLKKEDVPYEGVEAKMLGVKLIKVQNEDRPLLGLDNMKPLVLNKININVIRKMYGDRSEDWHGMMINVYHDPMVQMAGQVVGGVRIKPPSGWVPRTSPVNPPQSPSEPRTYPQPQPAGQEHTYVPGADEEDWA